MYSSCTCTVHVNCTCTVHVQCMWKVSHDGKMLSRKWHIRLEMSHTRTHTHTHTHTHTDTHTHTLRCSHKTPYHTFSARLDANTTQVPPMAEAAGEPGVTYAARAARRLENAVRKQRMVTLCHMMWARRHVSTLYMYTLNCESAKCTWFCTYSVHVHVHVNCTYKYTVCTCTNVHVYHMQYFIYLVTAGEREECRLYCKREIKGGHK